MKKTFDSILIFNLIFMFTLHSISYAQSPDTYSTNQNTHPPSNHTQKVRLRICTGSPQNHYYRVALMLAQAMSPYAIVDVLATKGSWENLGRIHQHPPSCDAMIAQDDAYTIYIDEHKDQFGMIERLTSLYSESVHLLCNHRIAANSLSELPSNARILVGAYGSGTFITWSLFQKLNPNRYGTFRTSEKGGVAGLVQIADGLNSHCMLTVNAVAQGLLAKANDDFGDRLKLLTIADPTFQTPYQQAGVRRALYKPYDLHKNVYPALTKEHIKLQQVDAVFFIHSQWKKAYPKISQKLVEVLAELSPRIRSSVD